MVSMLAVGAMSFTDVIQVYRMRFFVRRCPVVLDYGGYNTVHHKVLPKKPLHAHGHVKQVDDVQVQVELLLILAQQLVKINKKLKVFFHNHFVQPPHHQVIIIQDQAQVDRVAIRTCHNNHPIVDQMAVRTCHNNLPMVDHQFQVIAVRHMLVLDRQVEIQVPE